MKELNDLERLELAYKYSISETHKKILKDKIDKIKNEISKEDNGQQSFL